MEACRGPQVAIAIAATVATLRLLAPEPPARVTNYTELTHYGEDKSGVWAVSGMKFEAWNGLSSKTSLSDCAI